MPYFIKKVGRGYKVFDNNGKAYSQKPITLIKATAQMKALGIHAK